MADHGTIEPYNKEGSAKKNDEKKEVESMPNDENVENKKEHERYPSRGYTGYNKWTQERRYQGKFENRGYPHHTYSRPNNQPEHHYREEYRGRDYGYSNISHSISPVRESCHHEVVIETSPRGPSYNHHFPTSPLRSLSNSPQKPPIITHQFVHMDDPVERKSLLTQLDDLKHRLHHNYTENNVEINKLRGEKEYEIKDILAKKDSLVEESHYRIHCLKQQIEEEERKAERIREENMVMQKSHSIKVSDLQGQIEASQQRLEQIKREHDDAVREQIRRQDEEKRMLRDDYEKLIDQVRQEYQATREELKDILNDRNNLVEEAKSKLADLKKYYSDEMENLKREVDYLQESIQKSKQLNEKQNQEFEIARKTNKDLQNEAHNLQKEITKLTKDAERYEIENEALRSKIMRLDKLIYGKSKSPFKKFYK
jgi:myosin heavy subunit